MTLRGGAQDAAAFLAREPACEADIVLAADVAPWVAELERLCTEEMASAAPEGGGSGKGWSREGQHGQPGVGGLANDGGGDTGIVGGMGIGAFASCFAIAPVELEQPQREKKTRCRYPRIALAAAAAAAAAAAEKQRRLGP